MYAKYKYLTKKELEELKKIIIEGLEEIRISTDMKYYYDYNNILNIINSKLKKACISDEYVPFYKIENNTLILSSKIFKMEFLNQDYNLDENIKLELKQIGINLLSDDNLSDSLKKAIAVYLSADNKKELKFFGNRKFYSSLPYFDLSFNIIDILNIFVDNKVLIQSLFYGDNFIINQFSNYINKYDLKRIINFLNEIEKSQLRIEYYRFKYLELDDIYFKTNMKIVNLKNTKYKNNNNIIHEINNNNFEDFELGTRNKLLNVIHTYDKLELDEENLPFDFLGKLERIIFLIKEKINKELLILDNIYLDSCEYIIDNILIKYLKNINIDNYEDILKRFKYEIKDEYSFLDDAKVCKKLKKKLEK